MDFERVITALLKGFDQTKVRYAVIGGFALGALGIHRATMDFDILVHHEDLESLHRLLGTLGYKRRAVTENVSHYSHAEVVWGDVDILHACRPATLHMLQRARTMPIFNATQSIRVLEPEDIIDLKIQALANNPLRRGQETGDIELLAATYARTLDWSRVQEYYDLFELGPEGRQLRERFDHAQ